MLVIRRDKIGTSGSQGLRMMSLFSRDLCEINVRMVCNQIAPKVIQKINVRMVCNQIAPKVIQINVGPRLKSALWVMAYFLLRNGQTAYLTLSQSLGTCFVYNPPANIMILIIVLILSTSIATAHGVAMEVTTIFVIAELVFKPTKDHDSSRTS